MSYQDIPAELKEWNQWIIWQYEDIGGKKPTKVPYCPQTGILASVNDPITWSTFDIAVKSCEVHKFNGIGFVFSEKDPFAFIDLDETTDQISLDRQIKIFHEFNSYSEVSPSNKGLHIIVRGKVPAGRRRSFIEVYSSQRYATFTGNVYHSAPVVERQELLTQLWEQMGGGINNYVYKGDDAEKETDAQIINQCLNAINGDKFKILLEGKWSDLYPSQSEADFAFIDIVAFYTQNRNQIRRIYGNSILGNTDKKRKRIDYIDRMIDRSFDQMLPPIDFDGFKNAVELKIANGHNHSTQYSATPVAQRLEPSTKNVMSIPPGLVGEIAQFIYQASPRPVPEIAIAAAIGLMAGICGRAYNIYSAGLNHYILVLANTGRGKEAGASGVDKLMNAIKLTVPTSNKFIGPAEIASGQALIKYLNTRSQCFVSMMGEFGLRIQAMSSHNASSAERSFKRILLDLYNKTGFGRMFRGNIYSDKDKDIADTEWPSFSIYSESTPGTFYDALNEEMISEGLLPRFMIVEYIGKVPPLNKQAMKLQPSFQLVEKLGTLVAQCELVMHSKRFVDVQIEPEAEKLLDNLNDYCENIMNKANVSNVVEHLWSRAHMKALKLSALIAVGVNNIEPLVTVDHVTWAINMVQSDIKALSVKFETGLIGSNTNELKQLSEMKRVIKEYLTETWATTSRYTDRQDLYNSRIIPYQYLSRRLGMLSCFRIDRNGATFAVKRTIKILTDQDVIREIGKQDLANKFGTTQQAYVLSNLGVLN